MISTLLNRLKKGLIFTQIPNVISHDMIPELDEVNPYIIRSLSSQLDSYVMPRHSRHNVSVDDICIPQLIYLVKVTKSGV